MDNIDKNVVFIIEDIKKEIISTRNRVLENANSELMLLYLKIGKCIYENAKYGNGFIDVLSKSLKIEFPSATGYSTRNLARMKKFYTEYKDLSILPMPLAKLPWSFNSLLIDKIKELDKRIWYAEKCIENGWTIVVLDHQIDLKLYERQAENSKKLNNFSENLPAIQGELATEVMKDPYIFELVGIDEKVSEKNLEKSMVEKIKVVWGVIRAKRFVLFL